MDDSHKGTLTRLTGQRIEPLKAQNLLQEKPENTPLLSRIKRSGWSLFCGRKCYDGCPEKIVEGERRTERKRTSENRRCNMNDEARGSKEIFADRVFLLPLQQVQSLFNLNQSQFALMLLAAASIRSLVSPSPQILYDFYL